MSSNKFELLLFPCPHDKQQVEMQLYSDDKLIAGAILTADMWRRLAEQQVLSEYFSFNLTANYLEHKL